jgi:outer membrane immunogenic protein
MSLNVIKAGVAAIALFAFTSAAQAQTGVYPKKRSYAYAAPVVKRNWTGLYAGLNLGYGLAGVSDSAPVAVTSMMYGYVAGAQIGYNYQIDSIVLGVEADIQASGMSQSYSRTIPIVGNIEVGHKIPYFGTLRGRLGFAFDCGCVMAYATAGIAYGAYEPYATALGVTVSKTYTNVALAVGAGVEWKVAQQWSAKLEGLYLDTGNVGSNITLPVLGTIEARARASIMRLGVNYHF